MSSALTRCHIKMGALQSIPIGSRVVRGTDWPYGDQDTHMGMQQQGVVYDNRGGRYFVEWDNSGWRYHYGDNNLRIVAIPRQVCGKY